MIEFIEERIGRIPVKILLVLAAVDFVVWSVSFIFRTIESLF